ncbi:Glycosyl phosphatidyl inositol anchor synthesis [Clydaea vesicula]|uniref:GPI ethanolamine phosphate transferase 1 n=1 Tax=Clydaea vesicula TaxID=447962 RepID=A0AAD5XZH2_9FUNG|nr:Glycosyl phosphatidyl inositol anchor synthesis [Clydaea vesicula]
MEPVFPPKNSPADRLVLFVADGLRADKIFENKMKRAPFLKEKAIQEGVWGVSHTRVPTESRPGHVAIIAGFYEDVSAVTKDILPMFSHGTSKEGKMEMFMYASDAEDFTTDGSVLDTWVFEKFDEFLDNASKNITLFDQLSQKKICIFFHLLGLDTNGHAHRPFSETYLNNINSVDEGISNVVKKLEKFFNNDRKTSYIFTADHGMSDRGSHGDGHPDNTQTPLIAWGAGISKPHKYDSGSDPEDGLTAKWDMTDKARIDVNQADIAPLMSTLIGVPYPMNSVGRIPLKYIGEDEEFKAKASLGNAKQILRQYLVKEKEKSQTEIFFKPFKKLLQWELKLKTIEELIAKEFYKKAELKSVELVLTCLDGLRYYQTYDWLFLRSIISTGSP